MNPRVIGFMTECDSYHHVLQITEAIKRLSPECSVVLGGPHASAVARPTLERCDSVDAIVIGEGEETFVSLLDAIDSNSRDEWNIPGAITCNQTGVSGQNILDGGPRPLIQTLDSLPIPAYDLYKADPGEEIFIEVGRGCPFQCQFCSTAPFWGRKHRVKSPARILREIELVCNLFDIKRAHFTHDLFTTSREWVTNLCKVLIAVGSPMRWTCSARTDTVDEPLLELMQRAGCNAIYFGIESGSERILREIRKEIPLDHSFEVLEKCQRVGIRPNAGFIAGFPAEDNASLRDTFTAFERALRIGCKPTHLFGYCPFADSALYSRLQGLRCDGHFVDVPLGVETDLQNRQRVAQDCDLYGSYFRLPLDDIVPGEQRAMSGLDEFSPLAEAVLVPTLALSELLGGMYEVFRRWIRWIREYNRSRHAPEYRISYGTVAGFAGFVREELKRLSAAEAILEAAEAVEMNLRIAESAALQTGITMATYRSLVLPPLDQNPTLSLNSRLVPGAILGMLATQHDITPALDGYFDVEFRPEPTYLVWHKTSQNAVRLSRVDDVVFDALETLKATEETVGNILLERIRRQPESSVTSVFASLSDAVESELVMVAK